MSVNKKAQVNSKEILKNLAQELFNLRYLKTKAKTFLVQLSQLPNTL